MNGPNRRRGIVLGVAVGVVAALLVSWLVLGPPPSSAPNCPSSLPSGHTGVSVLVLADCDATVELGPHSYTSYTAVRLSDHEELAGQFTANTSTPGGPAAYLLNTTEWGDLLANPHPTTAPPNYLWTSGPELVGNISVPVPGSPTQYYLVLENNGTTAISVEWTQPLSIYYTETPPDDLGSEGSVGTPVLAYALNLGR